MNLKIRTPFYIFFLNLDYVAACSLRPLRSKETVVSIWRYGPICVHEH